MRRKKETRANALEYVYDQTQEVTRLGYQIEPTEAEQSLRDTLTLLEGQAMPVEAIYLMHHLINEAFEIGKERSKG